MDSAQMHIAGRFFKIQLGKYNADFQAFDKLVCIVCKLQAKTGQDSHALMKDHGRSFQLGEEDGL